MAEGAGSFFDLLRGSIPAPGSGLSGTARTPQLPMYGGSALIPLNPVLEAERQASLSRILPSGSAIPLPPVQTSTALVPGRGVQMPPPMPSVAQQAMNPRLEALRRLATLVNLAEAGPAMAMLPVAVADDATNYARIKYTGPSGGMTAPMNPYASTNNRAGANRAVQQQAEPVQGMSYSDYAEGKKNQFGMTALGGTQGLPTKGKATPATATRSQTNSSASRAVNTPAAGTTRASAPQQSAGVQASTDGQVSTGGQTRTPQPTTASATKAQQASGAKPSATQAQPQKQSNASAAPSAQPSSKATAKPSANPPATQKAAPVAQAKPSGEALDYFRKNKSSAGWDALGTAVSLVQQSLKPEKGGLKSRAEYDRLLRGSDNFKKLDGNEQQRVRQAFAQWMNEQTVFKGKA